MVKFSVPTYPNKYCGVGLDWAFAVGAKMPAAVKTIKNGMSVENRHMKCCPRADECVVRCLIKFYPVIPKYGARKTLEPAASRAAKMEAGAQRTRHHLYIHSQKASIQPRARASNAHHHAISMARCQPAPGVTL